MPRSKQQQLDDNGSDKWSLLLYLPCFHIIPEGAEVTAGLIPGGMKMSLWIRILVVALFVGSYASALFADTQSSAAKNLVLEKAGAERALPERILGGSAEGLIEHLTDNPSKVAALKDMDLAFVRFPGGSQSNYYNWRKGLLELNFLRRGPAGGVFQPDGKGGFQPLPHVVAMRWFNEAANGGATYQRFLEVGANRIPGGGALAESYLEVEAGLFRKPKAMTLIIQNCSSEPRSFNLSESLGGKIPQRIETLATPDLIKTPGPEMAVNLQPDAGGAVRLPPYSLTHMIWK